MRSVSSDGPRRCKSFSNKRCSCHNNVKILVNETCYLQGQFNIICGLMKEIGGDRRASHFAAGQNGELSILSHSSVSKTGSSEYPSKKSASSDVTPLNLFK